MKDGIDYVPMNKWKNALINLLNIAGTGPIFDLFKVFYLDRLLLSPFQSDDQRATHDYLSGMMSLSEWSPNAGNHPKFGK